MHLSLHARDGRVMTASDDRVLAQISSVYPERLLPTPISAMLMLCLSSSPATVGRISAPDSAVARPAMIPHRMRLTTTYAGMLEPSKNRPVDCRIAYVSPCTLPVFLMLYVTDLD